jgi:hypothetical protein
MCDEIISAMIDIDFPSESRREKHAIVCKRNAKSERDAFLLLYQWEGDFSEAENGRKG